MRAWRLTVGDIRFQWKYGFYAVYAIFTAVYLLALSVVPISARRVVAAVMIFTDPAAMGLFFMGAIGGLVLHWPAWLTMLALRADYAIKSIWCVSRLFSGKWIHEADGLQRAREMHLAAKK